MKNLEQHEGNMAAAMALSPWKTLIPKEHGAWAMLLVPFVIGAAVAGRWDLKVTLLLVSVLCLYVARNPLFI
ncbi:MAG: YwiC-like family protein, partial [Chloroflexi bacterium]|nr:YwiC-like family protein [Chloroflexota bacterium]